MSKKNGPTSLGAVTQSIGTGLRAIKAAFSNCSTFLATADTDNCVGVYRLGNPGDDASAACPGLVLGATARLSWDCFAREGAKNMARSPCAA